MERVFFQLFQNNVARQLLVRNYDAERGYVCQQSSHSVCFANRAKQGGAKRIKLN